MPDEEIIQETDEVQEPEPTPDPAAELTARQEAIDKRERELQKGFDEVARRKRELEEAAKPADDEDVPQIPEQTAKALDKWVRENYGSEFAKIDRIYADAVDNEIAKRGDPDAIKAVIVEYNLAPKSDSLADVREVLDRAEAIAKSNSRDPEAEKADMRKQILAELAEQGVQVETIAPKRSDSSPEASLDDDDLPSDVKVRLLKEKWGDLR